VQAWLGQISFPNRESAGTDRLDCLSGKEHPMSAHLRAFLSLLFCSLSTLITLPAHADDWLPVTPDELKMTSEPKAPGVPAIYLYRQVDRDDWNNREDNYVRIKIFTEEGRKYADVKLPFVKGHGDIWGIHARTIRPDGSIVKFDGKVYETTIVKAKGVKYLAKTFTLLEVQPGGIIEYRYTRDFERGYVFDLQWLLSEELFTKHAKFSLHRGNRFSVKWNWPNGLPEGTIPPKEDDNGFVRMEVKDVPAFQVEDYMPPENEMKFRVDFRYSSYIEGDPDQFWKAQGQLLFSSIEHFCDRPKAMDQAISQIVSQNDPPETKLEKIYARVQQIRNTSFERERTEQERKRQKERDIQSVEDLWKRGYGNGGELTWLFMALARAAGFQASPVLVSTRDEHFFSPKSMNVRDLNTNVVVVQLSGKDLYLDPGTQFAPYGMLPWSETGAPGLRLDKDGGSWVTTPLPAASDSRTERKASLQLTDSGSLEGKVTLWFTGLSALRRKSEERDGDDSQRKTFLENQLREYIPVTAEAELTNRPDWKSSAPTLVAEFDVKVPNWATAAGRRTVVPMGLFGGSEKHLFEHATRVHPIYFSYPYEELDDVTIHLPAGWQISSVPGLKTLDVKVFSYRTAAENKDGALHLSRQLRTNVLMVNPRYYDGLRNFYEQVRTGDEQQVILSSSAASAQN